VLAALAAVAVRTGAAASLGLASSHLWAGTQTLTKGTCTLSGTSVTTGAWVDQRRPTRSGSGKTLQVERRTNRDRWAFVRFDLSSCGIPATGGADSATLTLTMSNAPGSSRTLTLTPVLSSWDSSLTYSQAAGLAYDAPTTTFATGTTSGASFDLTVTAAVDALIKSPGSSFGWRIHDTGGSSSASTLRFDGPAAASPPRLTIQYEK
jgi:hypothetical protein